MSYSYNVPVQVIWSTHILIGLALLYLGYLIVEKKEINKYIGITCIVLGVLAMMYHSHLWYNHYQKKSL